MILAGRPPFKPGMPPGAGPPRPPAPGPAVRAQGISPEVGKGHEQDLIRFSFFSPPFTKW